MRTATSTPARFKQRLPALDTRLDALQEDQALALELAADTPTVCAPTSSVEVVRQFSNPVGPLKTLLEATFQGLASARAQRRASVRPVRAVGTRHRRVGWVVEAVVQVMTERQEPMQANEVHVAVEALLGKALSRSSIKSALATNVGGRSPRFVRVAKGRYTLS